MILILTQFEDDPTVVRLGDLLRERGADPVVVALCTLEGGASLLVENAPAGGARTLLRVGGREIDLAEVHAAWLWRGWLPYPALPRFRALAAQPEAWRFFEQQWQTFHRGFSLLLAQRGVFCVNPPPWNTAFEEKCAQLALAAECGLPIPPTLFAARLGPARAFAAAHGGDLVYKPFKPYVAMVEPPDGGPTRVARLLTNRVGPDDLVEGGDFLPAPNIFQPYVEKAFELRVVVVGQDLFACAIHSQGSDRSRDDWRRYDLARTPYAPYLLPPAVAAAIRRLMGRLGLVFGSVDLIVTPAGEHVFLEVNPNGQFDFVAQLAGLTIYERLADTLLAGRVLDPVLDPAAPAPPGEREVPDAAAA